MKIIREWHNGRLFKETRNGVIFTGNLGKTPAEMGLVFPSMMIQKTVPPQISPVPCDKWPLWARGLKRLARQEDKGIGDVVARTIGEEKSAAFKVFHKKITGRDCGCTGRQAKWNKLYPLNQPTTQNTP